jgi:hypothetical protein
MRISLLYSNKVVMKRGVFNMKFLWAGANILMPVLLLFLACATWIGYIAEDIREYYHFKWAALFLFLVGYSVQFYKKTIGLIIVLLSLVTWFLL